MSEIKTFGLKLTELRPCDACGKKLVPFFSHIQIRHAVFNVQNANGVLGLATMWGNSPRAFAIAEVMAPGADRAVEVIDDPAVTTTLFICNECLLHPLDLASIIEKRNESLKSKEVSIDGGQG